MHRTFTRWLGALALVLPALVILGGFPAHAASFRLPPGVHNPCAAATRGHATCAALTSTRRHGGAVQPDVTPAGFAPSDLRSAYSLPTSGSLGNNETVAVVTAYDDATAETDLGTYRTQFGMPACTTASGCFKKVSQTGGTSYPGTSAGWPAAIAQSLDTISAICPTCHLLLVEANSTAITDLGTAENEAVTLGADFVDNDWFTPELGLGAAETGYDTQYFDHPGVAITAPAGNSGYGVNYPAASPDVTAVGGTTLTKVTGGRGWSEAAWDGTGSGCSAYEPKPTWQTDTGCSDRTLNDTAAVGDPNTPIAFYDTSSNGWAEGGGTDIAAAIVAAVYALSGPPAPGTNPVSNLYEHPGANVFDVTSGSNGTCSPAYLCTAEVGYDGPTGWGTPDGVSGFSPYQVAFQANNNHLWYYTPANAGNRDTGLGMAGGTSPSVAATGEVAFDGSNSHLWLYDPSTGGSRDTGLGMEGGTSPAIVSLAGGGYEIAFQANTGILWLNNPSTGKSVNTGLGMNKATSPSVAATGEVAFDGSNNHLWLYDPGTGGSRDTGLGMEVGTSPAIVSLAGGGYEMAFQANTGILWVNNPSTGKSVNTGLGMNKATSPAIAATSSGGYEVAFEASNNDLWYYTPANAGNRDTGLGMAGGTSPSITDTSSDSPEVAFQASNKDLWYYTPANAGDLGLGMATGTSPAIILQPS